MKCKKKTEGRCFDCGISISSMNSVCGGCIHKLKQCEKCKKFNLPDAAICSCPKCNSLLNQSPLPRSITPSKPVEEFCSECANLLTKCTCILDLNCSLCNKPIPKLDGKICYKCKNDPKVKCSYCNKMTPKRFLTCNLCAKQLIKCEECGMHGIDTRKCENISCSRSNVAVSNEKNTEKITEHRTRNGSVHTEIKNKIKCRICDRELSSAYGFCLDCKLKINNSTCKFCQSFICKDLCEICMRSTHQCLLCEHQCHIADINCPICSN